jgi:multiple antibiotic resistance protein
MAYVTQFLKIFFTVLIIIDPIGIVPQFLAVTGDFDANTRRRIIRRSIIVAAIVMLVFVIFGNLILKFFGITPGAFYISGGILFFTIAYEMIQSKPRIRNTPESSIDPEGAMMTAVFPIAIPLIAGPGMITTIMLQVSSESFGLIPCVLLIAALAIGLVLEYFAMRSGTIILKFIGTTGMFVIEKIMGLILAGMSVQLIYDGLVKLNIVH